MALRLLSALLLYLAALDCFGQAVIVSGTLASASLGVVGTNAPAGDTCGTGHLLFSWHGESADVAAGSPAGCSVGDTTGTGNSGATISTDQYQDGSSSISIPTANDYYTFDWSSSDIVNPNAGTIDFWAYWTANTGGNLFYLTIDGANKISVIVDAGGYVGAWHTAGGTDSFARTGYPIITLDIWHHCKVRWDTTAHSGLYLKVTFDESTGEGNSADNGTTPLGTWAGTSGTLNIGDYGGVGSGVYFIDNIKIYDNWQ